MDGLSTAASVIAVLQLSTKVVGYLNSVKGATEERKRLRQELRACEYIIQQLKDETDDPEEGKAWAETLKALEAPGGPLGLLFVALRAVEAKLEPRRGAKKALATLKWPFDEKNTEKLFEAIEREKALLQLALSNDARKLAQEIRKNLNESTRQLLELAKESEGQFSELKDDLALIHGSQAVLHDGLERIDQSHVNRETSEQRKTILNWLTPVQSGLQQSDVISQRQPGTGQWLLESAQFKSWVDGEKRTLFCPGIPGAGKTVVTSIVVDEITNRFRKDDSIGLAFVFCNFRRHDEQKAAQLLATLAKQLAQSRPSLPEVVKSLYDQHNDKGTRPSLGELSRTLRSLTSLYSRAFIVVDALDECQTTDGSRMTFLSEVLNLQSEPGVSVFATSRYLPDIVDKFKHSTSLEIRASESDVRRYVDGRIPHLKSFVHRNPDLQEKIKTEIVKAVNGIFHLDSLIGKKSVKALEVALAKLPSGTEAYDHAYQEAMERIEGQANDETELAKQVLSWIVLAKRPLITRELQHALAVEIGEPGFDENNISDIGDVISVCAGLVAVDEESSVIRLVHYTTQEYFERTQDHWFSWAESEILKTCMTYLSFNAFERGSCKTHAEFEEQLQVYALYSYAACHWAHHASNLSSHCEEVLAFLLSETKVEAASQVLRLLAESQIPWYQHPVQFGYFSRQTTGLHLVAMLGLFGLAQKLLGRYGPNTRDSEGKTPLICAADYGHGAIVELFLGTEEVDINSMCLNGRAPLSYAAEEGHAAIVALLLATEGVDVDSRSLQNGLTPLSYAVREGHEVIVELLLATKKVDINSKSNQGITPLAIAAMEGHEAIVTRILATEMVDVNSKSLPGLTPLIYAAAAGHGAIVALLLDTEMVDVNSQSVTGETPLIHAIKHGHEAIVSMLLATDMVDVNLQTRNGQKALSCATTHGYKTIVAMLLSTGKVDVNETDANGWTPLIRAAIRGDDEMAEMLLENREVNVDWKDNDGATALSMALARRKYGVAVAICRHGLLRQQPKSTR